MAARKSPSLCPRFQAAVDLLGKRWTPLIVQILLAGPRRYSELSATLGVMSEKMLTERLREMEARGVVERRVLPDGPVRVEYRLTEKGRALGRVIGSLEKWAERWMTPP